MRERTGSIDTTSGGKHRARITVNGSRKTLGIYADREEAERELAAALEIVDAEVPKGALLGEYLETWLTKRELSGKIRDTDTERSWFKNHIASDPIARVPLRALAPIDMDEFVERLSRKLKPQSVRNVVQIVRGGLRVAARHGLTRSNVAIGVHVANEKRTEEPWTYATLEEQERIVRAAREHCADPSNARLARIPLDALMGFAMGSGLRAGELVTLRLSDVHVGDESPHVIVRYGTAPSLPTKTGKIRRVPLFGRALDGMRRWLEAMPAWAKENPHKLAFVGARGGFRSEEHVIRWDDWKAILKRAGISRPFRWHDFRHTCASSLVSGVWGRPWSLIEVRDMLGHSSAKTTERYAHLADTALAKAARETATNWPRAVLPKRDDRLENPGAPPRRIERPTNGLGTRGTSEGSPLDGPTRGQFVTNSIALLRAAEAGDAATVARLAREIAEGVLAVPHVRLAFEVIAGGPHAVAKAIDLAGLLAATNLPTQNEGIAGEEIARTRSDSSR